MTRQARPNSAAAIQLFPFLAVLLCTMGALLLMLVVIARHSRDVAARSIRSSPEISAAVEVRRKELQSLVDQLKSIRDKLATQFDETRDELGHVEDHARRVQDELAQLQRAAKDMNNVDRSDDGTNEKLRQRLANYDAELRDLRDDLERAKQDSRRKPQAYAIIPYDGPNQTRRRPIYIECRSDSVVLQPEGIIFGEADFMGPMGASNPLAAALRATREHLIRNRMAGSGDDGQPYPLLLVRPDGIAAYYAARSAMNTWGSDFGYELVEQDWALHFPPPDPALISVLAQTVDEARRRQVLIAAAAPRLMNAQDPITFRGGTAERVASGNGSSRPFQTGHGFNPQSFRGSPRAGTAYGGYDADHENNTVAALSPYADMDLTGNKRGSGGQGGAPAGNYPAMNAWGHAEGNPAQLAAANGAAAGPMLLPPAGVGTGGVAPGGMTGGGSPGLGTAGPAGGMNSGNGTGAGSAYSGGAVGTGIGPNGGAGSSYGSGPVAGVASGPTAGSTGNLGGAAGEGASSDGGGPQGNSLAGSNSQSAGTGGGATGGNESSGGGAGSPGMSSGAPGGASNWGGQPGGGGTGIPMSVGMPSMPNMRFGDSGSAANNASTTSAGQMASNPQGGNQPQPGGPKSPFDTTGKRFGQNAPQQSVAGAPSAVYDSSAASSDSSSSSAKASSSTLSKSQQQQLKHQARSKHQNWALPHENHGTVPIVRPISVQCFADRLEFANVRGIRANIKSVPFSASTADAIEPLVAGVWERINGWGTAGDGMFWRPVLTLTVQPGGEARAVEIQQLLANSGLEVKQHAPGVVQ